MRHTKRKSVQGDNVPLAVSVVVLTVFALSLGDALVKFSSTEFVIWQLFVVRSIIVLIVLIGYAVLRQPDVLKFPPDVAWVILRSLLLVVMWIAYYLALPALDLSIAAASYYTLPLFITLFSALLIGDRIRAVGWLAVLIGFVGVLLILRPQAGDINFYAFLPLLSAILYALAMILTRSKCRAVHPLVLSIALNVAFVLIGLIATVFIVILLPQPNAGFLTGPWVRLQWTDMVTMSLLAASILIGSVGAAIAYQKAPPSIVGTFDFAYVGFALLWSLIFFAEVPDWQALAGIVMIVSAGILSFKQAPKSIDRQR